MISVVIPTLNEAAQLGLTLECVSANGIPHEIVVADGGSQDATLEVAARHQVKTVRAPGRGRSLQMNLGAQNCEGDVLLFLHADTRLRPSSLTQILGALRAPSVVGGGFARRFDTESLFLRFTCALTTWRCRAFGWFLGDQAIFVRTKVFQELGGFRPMTAFEDLDFSRRLARTGKVVTLSPGVVSSSRRFARRGALRTTCHDLFLTCQYLAASRRWEIAAE